MIAFRHAPILLASPSVPPRDLVSPTPEPPSAWTFDHHVSLLFRPAHVCVTGSSVFLSVPDAKRSPGWKGPLFSEKGTDTDGIRCPPPHPEHTTPRVGSSFANLERSVDNGCWRWEDWRDSKGREPMLWRGIASGSLHALLSVVPSAWSHRFLNLYVPVLGLSSILARTEASSSLLDRLAPGVTDVVISTWFVHRKDPMHRKRKIDYLDAQYAEGWYRSLEMLDLKGIVLHNGLPLSIRDSFRQDVLSFLEVKLGNYSVNDERFFLYYGLLTGQDITNNPVVCKPRKVSRVQPRTKIKNIFFTDLGDVIVKKNPFHAINERPSKIYVGSEGQRWNRWMFEKARRCHGNFTVQSTMLYNAGLLGGSVRRVMKFLDCFVDLYNKLPRANRFRNCNMLVYNAVLSTCFGTDDVITGEPLHSHYKKFEVGRNDVYFIHK